ncbi:MAG: terminase family protein [Nitrososphaerota archaeon]|nr:terminase family protein [Nitrososphaerota archaeon]
MRRSGLAQLLLDAAETGIRLYKWQRRWLDDDARFRVLLKSRGVGGSFTVALEALVESLLKPGSLTLLVSYSQRQSLELFRKLRTMLSALEGASLSWAGEVYRSVAVSAETKTQVELGNGSRIISLPNNPDAIRGYRSDSVYVDEAGMFRNDFEVKSAVAPSIVGRSGRLSLVSTPKGRRGWFYEAWSSGAFSRHTAHYTEAPHITAGELEGLRKALTELEWLQEMETEFLDEANAVFPYELILSCVSENTSEAATGPVYVGVDVGRLRDSTVITALERLEDGTLRVFHVQELRGIDFQAQESIILNLAERLRPVSIAIDRTGIGLALYETLSGKLPAVEGVTFTRNVKEALIATLHSLMKGGKLSIPPDGRELINQLRAFQRVETPSGAAKYEAPRGQHDDYVMSLALAVGAAVRRLGGGVMVSRVWAWREASEGGGSTLPP